MATLRTPLTNLLANEYGFICFFFNIFLARLDFLYYLCTDIVVGQNHRRGLINY